MMESLKKLEEEQRVFESGAKNIIDRRKRENCCKPNRGIIKRRAKKPRSILKIYQKELDSAKSDLSKIDEEVMQGIMNDQKRSLKVSNLT